MAAKVNKRLNDQGLNEPFPSAPTRLPTMGFKVIKNDQLLGYFTFAETYAAQRFLETIINGRPMKWEDVDIVSVGDLVIQAGYKTALEDAIEYTPTKLEKAWVIPEPHKTQWLRIAGVEPMPEPQQVKPEKPKKEKAPKKERTPRASREGMTSLADIAKELDMDAREARGIMRKSSFAKPDAGWAWPSDSATLDDVRDILKEGRK